MKRIIQKNVNRIFLEGRGSKKRYNEINIVGSKENNNSGNFTDDGLFVLPEGYVNEEIELYDDFKIESAKLNNLYLYSRDDDGYYSLKMVHPELRKKMELLIEKCAEEGINIRITSDVRDVHEQNCYYAKGTSRAIGSEYQSYHQWGLAFDVCIVSNTFEGCYDKELLKRVGEIGKSLGLEWGGDWTNFPDMPHFQLKDYGDDINYLKKMHGNPAIFADTWNFTEEDLLILTDELGISMDELVKKDSIVLVADVVE